jgi:hypothetical protein
MLLPVDKSKSHNSNMSSTKIEELGLIRVLPLPYCPCITACDVFHVGQVKWKPVVAAFEASASFFGEAPPSVQFLKRTLWRGAFAPKRMIAQFVVVLVYAVNARSASWSGT